MDIWWITVATLVVCLPTLAPAATLDISQCTSALGMQSGLILDSALSASSSLDPLSLGPASARIRSEVSGGAWCPNGTISKEAYEYLEIDLLSLKVISVVETQGRFGHGQGQEYTEQYRLEYRREIDERWFRLRNRRGQEIFQGNTNTYIAEMRDVDPAFSARWVRFVPYSVHSKHVCLRVELYGCDSPSGVVSYSMQQGEPRSSGIDLRDLTYDGVLSSNHLSGGLGQLLDGEEGQANFRVDSHSRGQKGYEWVGWRNDSFAGKPVEILFHFDRQRNFTSMSVHCNNMFSKDVRVFGHARVVVGRKGGMGWGGAEPQRGVEYSYAPDTLLEYARTVTVPLGHIVGQELRVELYFSTRWMLISEVGFESEVVHDKSETNVSDQTATNVSKAFGNPSLINSSSVLVDSVESGRTESVSRNGSLLLSGHGASGSTTLLSDTRAGPFTPPAPMVTVKAPHVQTLNVTDPSIAFRASRLSHASHNPSDYIGLIVGALTVLVLILVTVIVLVIIRRRKDRCAPLKFANNKNKNKNKPSISTVDGGAYPALHFQRALDLPLYTHAGGFDEGCSSPTDPLISTPVPLITPYATSDLLRISGLNTPRGAVKEEGLMAAREFPRSSLKFVMSLGDGHFGQVYLCEVIHGSSWLGSTNDSLTTEDEALIGPRATLRDERVYVAVSMLNKDADEQTRSSFRREADSMSRLRDPHIARLLGVCTLDQPLCLVLEYLCLGDLKQFLQRHAPEEQSVLELTTRTGTETPDTLSYSCLLYMGTQIASGMKYLESLNVVHRDLACRNCLVGHNYRVKVSDLGTSRTQYRNDYCTVPGKLVLPLRWMSWEAVLLGRFSTKSDVWSFAVTLWEILTLARHHPYASLSDEQLILCCDQLYRSHAPWPPLAPPPTSHAPWPPLAPRPSSHAPWPHLAQPPGTARELCDLMHHCWTREEGARPTFHEIHMFLYRKNSGFCPAGGATRPGGKGETGGGIRGEVEGVKRDYFLIRNGLDESFDDVKQAWSSVSGDCDGREIARGYGSKVGQTSSLSTRKWKDEIGIKESSSGSGTNGYRRSLFV